MKTCDTCGKPSSHLLSSGWRLCSGCNDRIVAAVERDLFRRRPERIAAPSLFDEGER